jgi:hypothetical protein
MAIANYKIAVHILAVNGVSPILRVIAKDVLGLGSSVDAIANKFGRMKLAALGVSAAVAGIGAEAVKAELRLGLAGDRIVRAQAMLRASGVSEANVQAATQAAIGVGTTTKGADIADTIKLVQEMRLALGSTKDALAVLPSVAKDLAALKGAGYTELVNASGPMFKALDLLGAGVQQGKFNPAQFAEAFHTLAQSELLTHGLLSPNELLRVARLGGFTAQGLNFKDWLANEMAALMELGSRAGSGMAQAFIQFAGGRVSLRSVTGLERY